ncbi:MAG: hypothetical protein ACRD1V_01840 [Vicinamibacterales bacterium]
MAEPAPTGTSSNRNIMIVLAYLWLLALVPLLTEKQDKEVQWHAKHGIVLMVAEFICWIGIAIVSTILGMLTAGLGCLFSLLYPLLGIGVLVVHIMAIVNGVNGGRLMIPVISDYANKF